MNKQQKKDLLKAAELIAQGKYHGICYALANIKSKLDIHYDPVCSMFDPNAVHWWGQDTMGLPCFSEECRNARLLGIAFMLTMPEDMVDDINPETP